MIYFGGGGGGCPLLCLNIFFYLGFLWFLPILSVGVSVLSPFKKLVGFSCPDRWYFRLKFRTSEFYWISIIVVGSDFVLSADSRLAHSRL